MSMKVSQGTCPRDSYKGVIITYGLLQRSDVIIGPNYTRDFKDVYMAAKREGLITKTL